MKTFKLQALLDYRKRQADRAHAKLAAVMEKRSRLIADRKTEEKEILELRTELEKAKGESLPVNELILHEQFICAKNQRMRDLEDRLARADKEVSEKRSELVKARKKKRVLEILKQKRAETEERKQKHMESVFLDEVAVIGFGGGGR